MKKTRMIFAILVASLLIFSIMEIVSAKQGNGNGQNNGNKGENKTTENKTSVIENIEEKLEDRFDKIEEKAENATRKGQLVSALNQARRLQFRNMKLSMRQLGYHGEVEEFAVAFNRQIKELKADIKDKINSSNESNFTARSMFQIAMRELARIRTEKMAQLNISASHEEVNWSLINISEMDNMSFSEQIRYMNRNFKNMIVEIAKNGTLEEKKVLKEQIKNNVQNGKEQIKLRTRERLELLKLQRETIRDMLKVNKTSEEIVSSVVEK